MQSGADQEQGGGGGTCPLLLTILVVGPPPFWSCLPLKIPGSAPGADCEYIRSPLSLRHLALWPIIVSHMVIVSLITQRLQRAEAYTL